MSQTSTGKAGWRPKEWGDDVGVGITFVNDLIKSGAIKSVKLGKARTAPRIITTAPSEYLASLADSTKAA
jgi:hypothetical protein